MVIAFNFFPIFGTGDGAYSHVHSVLMSLH